MTTTAGPRHLTITETAAALRSRLRLFWPTIKFSVRRDRGTAAGWLTVQWIDGPTRTQVEAVAEGFCGSWFDTNEEVYRHQDSTELVSRKRGELPELVAYAAHGADCSRTYSPAAVEHAAATTGHTGPLERGQVITGGGHEATAPYDLDEAEALRLWLLGVDLTAIAY